MDNIERSLKVFHNSLTFTFIILSLLIAQFSLHVHLL